MTKTFMPIKSRRPWPSIYLKFFNKTFLVLGCFFFTPGVFWYRFDFFFKKIVYPSYEKDKMKSPSYLPFCQFYCDLKIFQNGKVLIKV